MSKDVVGYVLCEDSYLWTKRGILRVTELEETDCVLGLDIEKRGPTFQETIKLPEKLEGNHSVRLITDANEIIVPEQTKLYLIDGKRVASSISEGDQLDIFYRPKTFNMLKELYSTNKKQQLIVDFRRIDITENFAYLLGTQAVTKEWVAYKIIMMLESDLNWRKICAILKEAFHEIGLRYKYDYRLLYRHTRKKIIVLDESSNGFVPRMIYHIYKPGSESEFPHNLPQKIPIGLRLSPTSILRQFIEGVLDSRAKISQGGLLTFYTFSRDDEVHRFILMILSLLNIQPIYSFFNNPKREFPRINTYLALPRDHVFDLKSLALASQDILKYRKRGDVTLYSTVKHTSRILRSHYVVFSPKDHWDIIADLTPIHSQTISLSKHTDQNTKHALS